MKSIRKTIVWALMAMNLCSTTVAQRCWWVVFADKDGTTFDPYTYFDSKAIERYRINGIDLYDESNYPLRSDYVQTVGGIATEEVGSSRWFNAVAVIATDDQVSRIEALPFVVGVIPTQGNLQPASHFTHMGSDVPSLQAGVPRPTMSNQLLRMQGDRFKQQGIDGKGLRIAVFDGGFPNVDTHPAFKLLRDGKRIVATWNFCNRKENVYGWNTHGTMVLSCIAGCTDSLQMGLATGATFLLARTEIESEPFKEEVWWCQAVEWADKNGADIINSSLGYGKDRYYTDQMDGTSYVAKAANMAARKGILVCNSAGNEGTDGSWRTIITPADADSVLSVGGINASLSRYEHISFSSYGPTADGRMKPNVCNFGQATVANPGRNGGLTSVQGTSFSSPLTAGFCACAWQTRRDLTAMQIKAEVERSADLYPYCDYAYGYGVPQASYFLATSGQPFQADGHYVSLTARQATFTFDTTADYVLVHPTGLRNSGRDAFRVNAQGKHLSVNDAVFFKTTRSDGGIDHFTSLDFTAFTPDLNIAFAKKGLVGRQLIVCFDGYTSTYQLNSDDLHRIGTDTVDFDYFCVDTNGNDYRNMTTTEDRTTADLKVSRAKGRWQFGLMYQFGTSFKTSSKEQAVQFLSSDILMGVGATYKFSRVYGIGSNLLFQASDFKMARDKTNPLDDNLGLSTTNRNQAFASTFGLGLEFYQRVRLRAGGALFHNGLFWDFGIYSLYNYGRDYTSRYSDNAAYSSREVRFRAPSLMDQSTWNVGLTTRLVNKWYGLYARYRLNPGHQDLRLPRFTAGLMLYL